jgi:streptomycin 6-kinase
MHIDDEIDDAEAKRIYCQFCFQLHTPVPGRVPSLTCSDCWLEIEAKRQADK